MDNLKLIRKNFSWLLTAEVLSRGLMLILVIRLARVYGAEHFGVYALALSIGSLFEILFNFGLSTIFLQRVAGAAATRAAKGTSSAAATATGAAAMAEKMHEELKIFFPLRVILSLASLLFFTAFVLLLGKNPETIMALLFGGIYFSIFGLETFLWACFDARQKMHFTASLKFLQFALIFGLALLLTFRQAPVSHLMLAHIAAVIISLIATILLINHSFARIGFRFNFQEWKKILAAGWPIAMAGTFVFVYNYLDTIIISIIKGEADVGLYQAGYKIVGTLFLLAVIINQAYLPSLIQNSSRKIALQAIFHKALGSAFFWSIPITIGGMLLAERIILFIYGPDYVGGVVAFKILIWNCIIYFFSACMINLLYALKKQKSVTAIFFAGAVVNTVFNIFMIPVFGIEGAAVTTLAAELIVLAGIYILARKIIRIQFLSALASPLLSGLCMAAGLYFIKSESLFLTIGLGALIYFGSYFLLQRCRHGKAGPVTAPLHPGHDILPKD